VGIVYLAVLTRGFRSAPPEVEFTEDVNLGAPDGATTARAAE
jgi:hypothetical protein